jgi:acyl-CoA dehydrogenase
MCLVAEELFWGDAGAAMVIFGTNLALGGLLSAATLEQFAEWGPQCIGDAANPRLGA